MSWTDPCSYCGEHRADCDCGHWGEQKPKQDMTDIEKRDRIDIIIDDLIQSAKEAARREEHSRIVAILHMHRTSKPYNPDWWRFAFDQIDNLYLDTVL